MCPSPVQVSTRFRSASKYVWLSYARNGFPASDLFETSFMLGRSLRVASMTVSEGVYSHLLWCLSSVYVIPHSRGLWPCYLLRKFGHSLMWCRPVNFALFIVGTITRQVEGPLSFIGDKCLGLLDHSDESVEFHGIWGKNPRLQTAKGYAQALCSATLSHAFLCSFGCVLTSPNSTYLLIESDNIPVNSLLIDSMR
jgi:hypothetical protein